MRISSINVAQPRNFNYETRIKNVGMHQNETTQPTFKGLKAGFFAIVGATIGGIVGTAVTGGILGPFLLAGAGSILGGEYGSKDEPKSDEYGVPYDGPSGFDYIG